MKFERIIADPGIMTAKPCIKGIRITVELILQKLSEGYSYEDLLKAYPKLTQDDLREVFRYTHAVLTHESIIEDTVS